MTWEKAKEQVALSNGLGKTLVTGHMAKYWQEAAELYTAELNSERDKLAEENERLKLNARSAKIELLEKYSKFLQDHGYLDTDWNSEPPYAIDEFLKLP